MINEESHISRLPNEVLEFILSLVSPYKDLESCKLVCRKWLDTVRIVIRKHELRFHVSIIEVNVNWENLPSTQDLFTSISRRYSHAACYHDNAMYVFGGCTSTNTTFNDLWKLNLTTRAWVRPLPTGSYPSPKACATLVRYEDSLVLFGGWTQSSTSPLHQVCHLFNELNVYRLKTNKWDYEYTHPAPPSAAGHSATVHRNLMIVFGGIRRQLTLGQPSQEIINYNLEKNSWFQPEIPDPRPPGRYGQTQVKLDDDHLLIIGGCGGPNSVYNDVWLLSMDGTTWRWKELEVEGQEFSASHMWCSPGCKVDDKVVFLCKRSNNQIASSHPAYASHYNMSAQIRGRSVWVPPVENNPPNQPERPKAMDEPNINGRQGNLRRRHMDEGREVGDEAESVDNEAQAARLNNSNPPRPGSKPSIRPNAMRNRERQLEALKLMEERIHRLQTINRCRGVEAAAQQPKQQPQQPSTAVMSLCVLDISQALSHHRVRWIPPSGAPCPGSPEEAVLYSIVQGHGELVVFGGVQKFISTEATTNSPANGGPNIVSNNVYFIRPPRTII